MFKKDPIKEERLWQEFRTKSEDSSALVEFYMPFAFMMAKKQYKLLGFSQRDFDDFYQNACIGLMDAVSRFDDKNGAEFYTYASIRIKGSILNGLKQLSEKNQYYSYLKRIESERTHSIIEHNRLKNGSLDDIGNLIVELAYSHLLEDMYIEPTVSNGHPTPYSSCQLQQTQKVMRQYLQRLPSRESDILKWHYFEFFSFQEIADLLSISKGRVSQLHHKALKTLEQYCSATPELIA